MTWMPNDAELDALARADVPEVSAERAEQLRARLLAAQPAVAQVARRSAVPWIAGGVFAIAAAAVVILWLGSGRDPDPVAHAPKQVIESIGAARFESVNEWPDFVIRLDDGKLAVTVAALEPAERFRVKTADAEVEVRGTRFIVQADNGRIASVVVERGWVELRRTGEPPLDLRDGQRWDRVQTAATEPATGAGSNAAPSKSTDTALVETKPVESKPVEPESVDAKRAERESAQRPRVGTRPAQANPTEAKSVEAKPVETKPVETTPIETKPGETKPPATAPGEADFRAGWAALRAGKAADAAPLFVASCAVASGAIAEDACFWAAAAAKRAGRADTRALLEQFVRRFPSSSRAGEAAALLGWTLYDAGDLAGAEAQFRRAVGDRVPQVRDSAQRGLTAIERRRTK